MPRRGDAKAKGTRRGLTMLSHRAALRFDPTQRREFPLTLQRLSRVTGRSTATVISFLSREGQVLIVMGEVCVCTHTLCLIAFCNIFYKVLLYIFSALYNIRMLLCV